MKRMRPLLLTLSILTGLVVGFGGRGALTPPIDRPAEMIALFETYCLPLKTTSDFVPPEGLRFERVGLIADEKRWLDHKSLANVVLEDWGECRVSDIMMQLTKTEQEELERLVSEMVAEQLPELSAAPMVGLEHWDLARAWWHDPQGANQWGVSLVRAGSAFFFDPSTNLRFVSPSRFGS